MNANIVDQSQKFSFSMPLITGGVNFNSNPSILKNIIGQEGALKKLSFFLGSYSAKMPVLPTMLFSGSQGLGKSFMAEKVAQALNRQLVEVNCGTITTAKDFVEGVLFEKVFGEQPKTLLLDETQKVSPEITTILLSMLAPKNATTNTFSYKHWCIEYDFTKINTIFATTDAYRIAPALLNRCEEIYFNLYSNEELFNILKVYLPDITIVCDKEDLSFACRGRARDAFLISNNIRRYCSMNNSSIFDQIGWDYVKNVFGIHAMGLNNQEIALMKMISIYQPISSGNLAVKMGVNLQNIESELETRPRELGFIENSTRGRILTDKGIKYLKDLA